MFATFRIAWSRSSSSPASPTSRRPTPSSARSICRPTTPASPSIRLARAPPHAHPGVDLDEILCVRRSARSAPTMRLLPDLKLQIPESPMRPHFVKARVKVHVYPDGSHALFHGPRCISRLTTTDGSRRPMTLDAPLNSARRRACWKCGQRCACHSHRNRNEKRKRKKEKELFEIAGAWRRSPDPGNDVKKWPVFLKISDFHRALATGLRRRLYDRVRLSYTHAPQRPCPLRQSRD